MRLVEGELPGAAYVERAELLHNRTLTVLINPLGGRETIDELATVPLRGVTRGSAIHDDTARSVTLHESAGQIPVSNATRRAGSCIP